MISKALMFFNKTTYLSILAFSKNEKDINLDVEDINLDVEDINVY